MSHNFDISSVLAKRNNETGTYPRNISGKHRLSTLTGSLRHFHNQHWNQSLQSLRIYVWMLNYKRVAVKYYSVLKFQKVSHTSESFQPFLVLRESVWHGQDERPSQEFPQDVFRLTCENLQIRWYMPGQTPSRSI